MIFPNMELTNEGIALLGQVSSAVGTLVITKVKIGSGTYAGDIKLLTNLITPFREFPVNSVQVQPDSSVRVSAYFDNTGFLTSHEWREIGVYAQLGGSPATEILFSYTNGGANFDYIPSEAEGPYRHTLDIRNYISDVTSVSFLITTLTDKYDFNTHAEMIAATYLVDGDRVNLWGKTSQNDGIVEKRVIKVAAGKDGVLLTNGLYANLLGFDFREEINLNVGGQKDNYKNMQDVPLVLDGVYIDSNTGIKYKCHAPTVALPSPNPDYVTEITNKSLQKQIENLSVDFVIASGINYTKWNSGKLECFGRCSVSTAGKLNNLPKSFIDQYYMIAINPDSTSDTTTFLATGNRKSVDSFIGICANFASQGHTSSYYAVGRWK